MLTEAREPETHCGVRPRRVLAEWLAAVSQDRESSFSQSSIPTVLFLRSGEAPGGVPEFTVWLLCLALGVATGVVLVLFCLQYSSDVQKLVGLAGSYPRLVRELEEEGTALETRTSLSQKGFDDIQNVSGTSTSSDHTRDSGVSTPALLGGEDSYAPSLVDEGQGSVPLGERQSRASQLIARGISQVGPEGVVGASGDSEVRKRSISKASLASRKAVALQGLRYEEEKEKLRRRKKHRDLWRADSKGVVHLERKQTVSASSASSSHGMAGARRPSRGRVSWGDTAAEDLSDSTAALPRDDQGEGASEP